MDKVKLVITLGGLIFVFATLAYIVTLYIGLMQ